MNVIIERVENSENWDIELDYFQGSLFMARPWIESVADHERTPVYLRFRNGTTIIDNQPVYGPTGGALQSDVFAPGPIFLQGDHGPVSYRNMLPTPVIN